MSKIHNHASALLQNITHLRISDGSRKFSSMLEENKNKQSIFRASSYQIHSNLGKNNEKCNKSRKQEKNGEIRYSNLFSPVKLQQQTLHSQTDQKNIPYLMLPDNKKCSNYKNINCQAMKRKTPLIRSFIIKDFNAQDFTQMIQYNYKKVHMKLTDKLNQFINKMVIKNQEGEYQIKEVQSFSNVKVKEGLAQKSQESKSPLKNQERKSLKIHSLGQKKKSAPVIDKFIKAVFKQTENQAYKGNILYSNITKGNYNSYLCHIKEQKLKNHHQKPKRPKNSTKNNLKSEVIVGKQVINMNEMNQKSQKTRIRNLTYSQNHLKCQRKGSENSYLMTQSTPLTILNEYMKKRQANTQQNDVNLEDLVVFPEENLRTSTKQRKVSFSNVLCQKLKENHKQSSQSRYYQSTLESESKINQGHKEQFIQEDEPNSYYLKTINY